MRLPFYKYQGTGNDFIMLDYTSSLDDKLSVVAIQQLCDRKFGIGADGLIVIQRTEGYDFEMVYYLFQCFVGADDARYCLLSFRWPA